MRSPIKNEFVHPELKPFEVFFTNQTMEFYYRLNFNTKRIGQITYDGQGERFITKNWFPIFINRKELSVKKINLISLRKKLNVI